MYHQCICNQSINVPAIIGFGVIKNHEEDAYTIQLSNAQLANTTINSESSAAHVQYSYGVKNELTQSNWHIDGNHIQETKAQTNAYAGAVQGSFFLVR